MKMKTKMTAVVGALLSLCSFGCGIEPDVNETQVEAKQAALGTTNDSSLNWGGICNGFPGSPTTCEVRDVNGNNPTTMHCCPPEMGMEGFYQATDTFFCRGFPSGQGAVGNKRTNCKWRNSAQTVDGRTMLSCNYGEYMIGYHHSLNRVACCPTNTQVFRYVDGDNEPKRQTAWLPIARGFLGGYCDVDSASHTCNPAMGELMSGIHVNNNWFICSR